MIRARRELRALQEQTGISGDISDLGPALSDARARLTQARETYGPEHPEVTGLEREVAALEKSMRQQLDAGDAMVRPDNPAYIQISAQIEGLGAEENALNGQQRELRQRIATIEANMLRAPQVEQELFSLQRQLQTETQRYIAMRDRQFGAEMGQQLESQSKGERFVLVEPPDLPLLPSSPNRPALLLLLLILAPAIGIGVIQLKEAMDDAVWAPKDVEAAAGRRAHRRDSHHHEQARHRRGGAWRASPAGRACRPPSRWRR